MSSDKDVKTQDGEGERDVETTAKKIPYPKSVFFILANEFCERFSFYGMKAVLTLYLKNVLKFNEDTSTIIYHAFVFFTYFTPLFGAMIADSFLGKFRTIFYLSIVYAIGNITLSLAATTPLHIPGVPFSMLGLALIAMGTGGIKPCVSSFGGDQFILPQQERQLSSFFSIFYFSINAGSTLSTFLTPILRRDVQCFGDDTCYPLAFMVPAALMITSLIIFLLGKSMYIMRQPTGNVVISLIKAVKHALSRKRNCSEKKEHWMDYADDKYTKREIEDIKIVLRVLFLFIPVPLYWSLYDQQGSRWTFQASRMDGDLGGFVLKPDQLQVINPILVMLLIPLFDRVIYPALAKCNLMKKPLQKMVVGGTFVACAFIVSGIVEIQLEKTYPTKLGNGEAHINFMNMANLNLNGSLKLLPDGTAGEWFPLAKNESYLFDILPAGRYEAMFKEHEGDKTFTKTIQINSKSSATFLVSSNADDLQLTTPIDPGFNVTVDDILDKHGEGKPYIRLIQIGLWEDPYAEGVDKEAIIDRNLNRTIVLDEKKKSKQTYEFLYEPDRTVYPDHQSAKELEVEINTYDIIVKTEDGKERVIGDIKLKLGGSYVLTVIPDPEVEGNFLYSVSWVTEPNSINMLWLVPQYFIISSGEIMFQVTIMDFCYSQAPKSMKSVMQSAWLLTVAIGNLIDVIIAALKLFDSQWKEFFLFAGLMFVDLIIFAYMAYKYVPAELQTDEDDETTNAITGNNNKGNENEGYESDKDR